MGTKRTKSELESAPWVGGRGVSGTFVVPNLQAPRRGAIYLVGVLHTYQKTARKKSWVVKIGTTPAVSSVEGKIAIDLGYGQGLRKKKGIWNGHGTFGAWVEVPDVHEGERRMVNVLSQLRDSSRFPALFVNGVWNDKYARDHDRPDFYLHLRRCKRILKYIAVGMHVEKACLSDGLNGETAPEPYDPVVHESHLTVSLHCVWRLPAISLDKTTVLEPKSNWLHSQSFCWMPFAGRLYMGTRGAGCQSWER
jgi:hypothetical protein